MEGLPRVPSSGTGLAVFTCYDQLRREIQALLAENEELKRAVELIRENQRLRDAVRGRPDAMPNLLPVFIPTPRSDSSRFFSLANNIEWDSGLTDQSISFRPLATATPLHEGPPPDPWASTSLSTSDSDVSSGVFFPFSRRRTFAGNVQASPGQENYHPQRLSCPIDRFGAGGQPPDAPLPAEQPLPLDLQALERSRLAELQASGARLSFPASPAPEQPPPEQPPLPQSPLTLSPAPLSPIPLPPAQGLPEPPEPRTPEQPPPPAQRSPDVRPKEHPRKIARATDRPVSVRESPRPGSHRDPKQQMWERIVGEIAFQLDRRILSSVFPDRVRLYGFTVSNIPEKIMMSVFNNSQAGFDERYCAATTRRYVTLMQRLKALGYSPEVHPSFTESVVNTYGILRERPELSGPDAHSYNNPGFLRRVVLETVPPALQPDMLLLLECLQELAQEDGKPMFIW